MAGQFDYSINIPQPPAQNFLQSLMGIRQLQQMEDQSAIQQQQAGFQAQQAQFAQELQPLKMDEERARIAQLRQATSAAKTSEQATAYQFQQRKDLDSELKGISSDPSKLTAGNLEKLAVRFYGVVPGLLEDIGKFRKNIPDQVKIFGDNTAKDLIITSVTGNSEEAIKQLDKRIEAAKNTPELQSFVPQLERLKDSFIKYPDQAVGLAAVGQTLFSSDQGKAITDIMAKQAEIKETEEKTKKEKAATEGQLLDNRIKQYEADTGMSLKDIAKNKEEKFKAEAAERVHVESNPFVRKYIDSRTAFEMIKTADPNASGDETLLAQFVKMGDPGSVVSMSEKGGVKNVTFSDYIASLQAKLSSDGSLGDAKRKELKTQAFKMLQAPLKQYKEYQEKLEPVYKERGFNPKNIFVLPSSEQLLEEAKNQPAAPAGAPGLPISTGNIPVAPTGRTPSDVDAILKQFGVR